MRTDQRCFIPKHGYIWRVPRKDWWGRHWIYVYGEKYEVAIDGEGTWRSVGPYPPPKEAQ